MLYWRILCRGIFSKIQRCLAVCFRPHNLNILLLSESTAYLLQASTKPGSHLLTQEFSTVNKLYHLPSFSCHSLQELLITKQLTNHLQVSCGLLQQFCFRSQYLLCNHVRNIQWKQLVRRDKRSEEEKENKKTSQQP